MTGTKQTHLSLSQGARKTLERAAKETGKTMTAIAEQAIDGMNRSCCDGSGLHGWHAGSYVYCKCRQGLELAMSELSDKMNILSEDLATMLQCENNADSRARKEFYFETLKAEHDSLERRWKELSE